MNIFAHEIPDGSKLYFGRSAQLKRHAERVASDILEAQGFEEIITPFFSYHQHLSVHPNKLLRFSDTQNSQICLRADSTVDVVRIATKRLKNASGRYYYIQPVFSYPSTETYQIGAEILGENPLNKCIATAAQIFNAYGLTPAVQLSNIEIPRVICELLNLPIEIFEAGRLEILLKQNQPWLTKLANINDINDINDAITIAPEPLKPPLTELKNLAQNAISDSAKTLKNIHFAPLYYSKMRYYDRLFFRFIQGNSVLCGGGDYSVDGTVGAGFAIFTDMVIQTMQQKESK